MPSTTAYLSSQFPGADEEAEKVLMSAGYLLHPDWTWHPPANHVPTEREVAAIIYLIEEWDFDGLHTEGPLKEEIESAMMAWNRARAIKEGWYHA